MKEIVFFAGLVVTALVYFAAAFSTHNPLLPIILAGICFLISLFLRAGIFQVNEWERIVVLEWGKFKHIVGPGIIWLTPIAQSAAAIVDTRVMTKTFTGEQIMSKDNVALGLTIVLRFQIIDPRKAIVDVQNYVETVEQAAQAALQNAIGRATLDNILSERENLDFQLLKAVDQITEPWGVRIVAVEIKDIVLPISLQQVMAREAEARRDGQARLILANTECEAAKLMANAAIIYAEDPIAFQLRGMQMLVEVAKDQSTFFIIPANGFSGMDVTALPAAVAKAMIEEKK